MTSTAIRNARPSTSVVAPTGPPPRWSRAELLPPALLLALGTVLLLPGYDLWYDELFTAEIVRLPLRDIVAAAVEGYGPTSYLADVPPSYNAPYYVVVNAWAALPGLGGDTSLRVFSLLASTAGLALLVRAVTRLAGRPTGVLAGAVLAASPMLVELAVEARSYGLAVLATGGAALGLARWLTGATRGLLLFGLAGAGMGMAHWYALTVLAAFVVAGVLLRPRRAVPVLATGLAAALPTVALVAMNILNGTGARNASQLKDTDGRLAELAITAWAGRWAPLLCLTVGLAAVGAVRSAGVRVLGVSWVITPLVLLGLAELLRPVYTPRYLLTGLLGLGILAAAGVRALPAAARAPMAALLVACSLIAAQPVLDRGPRERGAEVVRYLAAAQRPGEPIVAADRRSALGLDHYGRSLAPRLARDVVVPPDDPPPGADRVWLVRRLLHGVPEVTDDEAVLRDAGLRLVTRAYFQGSRTYLLVQLWSR